MGGGCYKSSDRGGSTARCLLVLVCKHIFFQLRKKLRIIINSFI